MNARSSITFAIPDLQTGYGIIARLPLTNPNQASSDLNRLLDSLLAAPPDCDTYFRLLEHARIATSFIAEERAKRYLNKPLPLGEIEEDAFQQVVATWLKMAEAYAQCAQNDSPAVATTQQAQRLATILQRCISYTGMAIVGYQHAHREYPWGLWLDLHGYFASAEEWGVDTLVIPDAHEIPGHYTHCSATYLSIVLCDLAGCYGLSVRQQIMLRRWTILWSPSVTLHRANPGELLPLQVIDLMQDTSLRPTADCLQTDQIRRMDTTQLTAHIYQIRLQLSQKIPPSQLALGEDCTSGQCQRLLDHLAGAWSLGQSARKFRRRSTSGIARLCSGFDEMHFYISGKKFEQPENVLAYSRREFDSLFVFRHQVDSHQMLHLRQEQANFSADTWEVVNQSANGFRLVRSITGRKMSHGQLLAICPHDGNNFILAKNTWLMQEKGGGLIAGLEALPGLPVAIAARVLERVVERLTHGAEQVGVAYLTGKAALRGVDDQPPGRGQLRR
ncbi:MAG: hypothetical protein WCL27_09120 [Betaproteobacteria bacterium]